MPNVYIAGQVVEFIATFVGDNGTNVTPSTVAFKYAITWDGVTSSTTTITWNGSQTVPAVNTIAQTATGVFECQLSTTSLPGYYLYEWISTGTGQTTAVGSIQVDPLPL